jgi:hypothetical protein
VKCLPCKGTETCRGAQPPNRTDTSQVKRCKRSTRVTVSADGTGVMAHALSGCCGNWRCAGSGTRPTALHGRRPGREPSVATEEPAHTYCSAARRGPRWPHPAPAARSCRTRTHRLFAARAVSRYYPSAMVGDRFDDHGRQMWRQRPRSYCVIFRDTTDWPAKTGRQPAHLRRMVGERPAGDARSSPARTALYSTRCSRTPPRSRMRVIS